MSLSDWPISGVPTRLACLHLSGADALKFLQGQLSCDVRPLAWQDGKGGISLAARLNLKGRVMTSLYVLGVADGFLLLLPPAQADALLADLTKYILFSKATLVRDERQVWAQAAGINAPAAGDVIEQGADLLARLPHQAMCLRVTAEPQAEPVSDAFALAQIAAGIAQILPETAGLWLPQELGYDGLGAVSYNKGCYLGQEIVARLHFKGEVKQHLYRVALTGSSDQDLPPLGSALQSADGKTHGQLVQAVAAAGTSANARHLTCLALLRAPVVDAVQLNDSSWQVAACVPAVAP